MDLYDVEMNDSKVLHHIFHHAVGQWQTCIMRDTTLLITRIVQHNIIPKMGSFDQIYRTMRRAIYVIMGGVRVNWAWSIMLHHLGLTSGLKQSYIPYCHLFTRVFKTYGMPLYGEPSHRKVDVMLDRSLLRKMGVWDVTLLQP